MHKANCLVLSDHPENLSFLALADSAESLREAPLSFLLMPYGKINYTKGETKDFYEFGEDEADKILSDFAERKRDIVFDYEHQTLSGKEAPAAGWINKLEKSKDGLVAHMKNWTDKAKNYLQQGEYRYFSPVLYTSRRRPFALHSVALTNHPATHGNPALVMNDKPEDKQQMKELLELLGLVALADDDKSNQQVVDKVKELLGAKADQDTFLKLHDCADLNAVTGKIKGMVPASELTALNDKINVIEADKAVAKAFDDGKLVEAQRDWALGYATDNLKAFNDFVEKAPKIAPQSAQEAKVKTEDDNKQQLTALSDSEVKIFKQQGLTDDQIEDIRKERSAK